MPQLFSDVSIAFLVVNPFTGEHPYAMSLDVISQNNGATIPTRKRTKTDIPMQDFEKTYNNMQNNQGSAFTEQFQVHNQQSGLSDV